MTTENEVVTPKGTGASGSEGRGLESLQLHPTIIEVADFQRLLLFYNSLVTYIGHHFTFKFI